MDDYDKERARIELLEIQQAWDELDDEPPCPKCGCVESGCWEVGCMSEEWEDEDV